MARVDRERALDFWFAGMTADQIGITLGCVGSYVRDMVAKARAAGDPRAVRHAIGRPAHVTPPVECSTLPRERVVIRTFHSFDGGPEIEQPFTLDRLVAITMPRVDFARELSGLRYA